MKDYQLEKQAATSTPKTFLKLRPALTSYVTSFLDKAEQIASTCLSKSFALSFIKNYKLDSNWFQQFLKYFWCFYKLSNSTRHHTSANVFHRKNIMNINLDSSEQENYYKPKAAAIAYFLQFQNEKKVFLNISNLDSFKLTIDVLKLLNKDNFKYLVNLNYLPDILEINQNILLYMRDFKLLSKNKLELFYRLQDAIMFREIELSWKRVYLEISNITQIEKYFRIYPNKAEKLTLNDDFFHAEYKKDKQESLLERMKILENIFNLNAKSLRKVHANIIFNFGMLKNCTSLESLTVKDSESYVINSCEELEKLSLKKIKKLGNFSIDEEKEADAIAKDLIGIFKQTPDLKCLKIPYLDYLDSVIVDVDLPKLEKIDITRSSLSETLMKSKFPKLKCVFEDQDSYSGQFGMVIKNVFYSIDEEGIDNIHMELLTCLVKNYLAKSNRYLDITVDSSSIALQLLDYYKNKGESGILNRISRLKCYNIDKEDGICLPDIPSLISFNFTKSDLETELAFLKNVQQIEQIGLKCKIDEKHFDFFIQKKPISILWKAPSYEILPISLFNKIETLKYLLIYNVPNEFGKITEIQKALPNVQVFSYEKF